MGGITATTSPENVNSSFPTRESYQKVVWSLEQQKTSCAEEQAEIAGVWWYTLLLHMDGGQWQEAREGGRWNYRLLVVALRNQDASEQTKQLDKLSPEILGW